MIELIPKEILSKLPHIYESVATTDPICYVKFFTPDSNFTWYVIELSKDDLNTCYGYVKGLEDELGYFTLSELKGTRGALGLGVELDTAYKAMKLSEVKKLIK